MSKNNIGGQPVRNDDILEIIEMDGDDMEVYYDGEEVIDLSNEPPEDDESEDEEIPSELMPLTDDAVKVLSLHKKSVLCCVMHPSKKSVIATGGEDDLLYVVDIDSNNEVLFKYNFTESVDFVAFSFDGKFLAAADLNGNIAVFDTNDYSKVNEFELSETCVLLFWHHSASVLFAGSSGGLVYIYKVPSGDCKLISTTEPTQSSAAKLFPDGLKLARGVKGALHIVDIKSALNKNIIKPSEATILCLDVHPDNNSVIAGCDDGSIFLANATNGTFSFLTHPNAGTQEIEVIKYNRDGNLSLFAAGSNSGLLTIWDHSRKSVRYEHNYNTTVVQLVWHPTNSWVFTCHNDFRCRLFDARSGTVLITLQGHTDSCLWLDLSFDGKHLVTASDDHTARIFNVENI